MNTLEASGQWTFKRADGQPATDMTDAATGTEEDLAWTDEAVAQQNKLSSWLNKERRDNQALQRENQVLQDRVAKLLRERKQQQLAMDKEREKMKVRYRLSPGKPYGLFLQPLFLRRCVNSDTVDMTWCILTGVGVGSQPIAKRCTEAGPSAKRSCSEVRVLG